MLKLKMVYFLLAVMLSFTLLSQTSFVSNGSTSNWLLGSSWTRVSGAIDSDNIPDINDTVLVSHVIVVDNSVPLPPAPDNYKICAKLTISASGSLTTTSSNFYIYGDFVNSGSVTINNSGWYFRNNAVFTSTGTFSIASGLWALRVVTGNRTISSGTTVSCSYFSISSGATLTNNGTLNVGVNGVTNSLIATGGTLNNSTNGSLSLRRPINISGSLVTNTNPNTVTYTGSAISTIYALTYHHLIINNGSGTTLGAKTLGGALTVNGDLTIASNVVLNCAGFGITSSGNWVHNGITTSTDLINQGVVTFSGSNPTVTRSGGTERLNNVQVSPSSGLTLGSDLQCGSLTLNSGTFDLSNSNFTCHLTGNLVVNAGALINARNGKFRFIGSAAQTISGAGTPTFYDLIVRNAAGLSVSSNILMTNLLTDSLGSVGTSALGTIRLVANGPTQYARIGPVIGSLTGTGWVVDSYINGPAVAGWQWLSSPINGNRLSDWDNDTRFYMSGVSGNEGVACCPIFRSVRVFTTSTNSYTHLISGSAINVNHVLVRGKGYSIWMSDNLSNLTAPLVYNSVGTPNFANVNFAMSTGGSGWNLVGNPYACPIDFSTLSSNNPNINSSGFLIQIEDGSNLFNPNGGVISPNQGFMVSTTLGGNLVFSEACKNTSSLPDIRRETNENNTLRVTSSSAINGLKSSVYISLSKENSDLFQDNSDMPHLVNSYEDADNIWSVSSDEIQLSVNKLESSGNYKKIPLFVNAKLIGKHTMTFSGLTELKDYNCIWVENLSSGESFDLTKSQTIDFFTEVENSELQFVLHLENRIACESLESALSNHFDLNQYVSVFNNGSGPYVKFLLQESRPVTLETFNLVGQKVCPTMNLFATNDLIKLDLPAQGQVYMVVISSGDQVITRKVTY